MSVKIEIDIGTRIKLKVFKMAKNPCKLLDFALSKWYDVNTVSETTDAAGRVEGRGNQVTRTATL